MATKLEIISGVLSIRRYAAIAIISGLGMGLAYYYLTMSMLPTHVDAAYELAPLFIASSIALTVIISGLAGVNFGMIAFKIQRARMMNSARSSSSAIFGGAFAAFTPGCPACTAPLAVILGTVGGLSLFPMQGLELKIVSAGILTFAIWWTVKGLQKKSCCKIG